MPCFKGLAVSIHTNDGPLPEFAVQRSSRLSRISSYIPVPPARIPDNSTSNRPEQSSFAISITLLTPGQEVPYSAAKSTHDDPYPRAKYVGELPGSGNERGRYTAAIGPYIPLTTSPNETIAAYIYFDGRSKEEVATLLRRGEETWVNSRWVGVPESEGGGLAEREFLFREVGLERWLNGLDLEGKDAAATIERRRQKMEKRRRRRKEPKGSDDEDNATAGSDGRKRVLKYGADGNSPVEAVSDDDDQSSGSDSSDDDDPMPEAAGQIKVALFRVLASGEIKRGEYSPQFDAHDDDDDSQNGKNGPTTNGEGKSEADVDHTTSFAKPKTLDPKSISTQTVTGIDPTDKPYAVFTFLYRGERQLQKMGILQAPKSDKTAATTKRKSVQDTFASLGPLKKEGTMGFSAFREMEAKTPTRRKSGPKVSVNEMDSDSEDDEGGIVGKMEDDVDIKKENALLSPEDTEQTGELAEGVRKIKLKRQHSAEPLNGDGTIEARKTSKSNTPSAASTPKMSNDLSSTPPLISSASALPVDTATPKANLGDDSSYVGSPMKKHRMSMPGFDDDSVEQRLGGGMGMGMPMGMGMGMGMPGAIGEILGSIGHAQAASATASERKETFGGAIVKKEHQDDEEEL